MKTFVIWLKFHWNLFPSVQLTITQYWFRGWLGTKQVTSHYQANDGLVHWHIYASLDLDELIYF